MALTDSLDAHVAILIANQLGALFPYVASARQRFARAIEVAETAQVWMLAVSDVRSGHHDMDTCAFDTRLWHAQVRIDGRAQMHARFERVDDEALGWRVTQLFSGELAAAVDRAIEVVDASERNNDSLVRILEAPGYQMTFLWLQDAPNENRLLPVWTPHDVEAIATGRYYEARELLDILRDVPTVEGLTFE